MGKVKSFVAAVNDQRSSALQIIIHIKQSFIVGVKALCVGVQLYSQQTGLQDEFRFFKLSFAVRVKRSKAVKLSVGVYLAADKCVDTPRLFWFCCDRQKDKFVDTCAFSLSEQLFACSDTGRRYTIKVARGIGCLFCDFVGIDVRVKINDPHFRRHLFIKMFCKITVAAVGKNNNYISSRTAVDKFFCRSQCRARGRAGKDAFL